MRHRGQKAGARSRELGAEPIRLQLLLETGPIQRGGDSCPQGREGVALIGHQGAADPDLDLEFARAHVEAVRGGTITSHEDADLTAPNLA